MADETRGVWGKPKLVVLVRNRPEETVLSTCKTYQAGGSGSGGFNNSCTTPAQLCYECSSLADS